MDCVWATVGVLAERAHDVTEVPICDGIYHRGRVRWHVETCGYVGHIPEERTNLRRLAEMLLEQLT